MPVKKFLDKIKSKGLGKDEFVEVEEKVEEGKVKVRIESLRDYSDTDRVQELIRDGNVVFLRIKDLRQKDITELKKSVDKLRKTCVAMNGDIIGVNEDFLVITPKFAKIYRGKTA